MTRCETFKNIKEKFKLRECPYNKCCDGKECLLLRTDSRVESPEDRKQKADILTWEINRQKERLN